MAKNYTSLNENISQFVAEFNSLANVVGDLTLLTTDDSDIVGAINALNVAIGDNVSSVDSALTLIQNLDSDQIEITQTIGSLSGLATTNKDDVVSSINEVVSTANDLALADSEILSNIANLSITNNFLPVGLVDSAVDVLDLSNGNHFFHDSELSTATSLVFTNAPSKAKFDYTYKAGLQPYDLTAVDDTYNVFDSHGPILLGEDNPYCFNSAGTILLCGNAGIIYSYELSTAWDLSTATFSGDSKTLSEVSEFNLKSLSISENNRYVYAHGTDTDKLHVYQYADSTGLPKISDTTFRKTYDPSTITTNINPSGFKIKNGGRKMFVFYDTFNRIHDLDIIDSAYVGNLSRPGNTSVQSFGIFDIGDIGFNDDGTKLYVAQTDAIADPGRFALMEYSLASPWVTDKATLLSTINIVDSDDGASTKTMPFTFNFMDGGTKFSYQPIGTKFIRTRQMDFGQITLPENVTGTESNRARGDYVTLTFETHDSGANYSLLSENIIKT